MARLILLNGPPGCGKSTLAQMYVDEHPMALNLDIDRVRSLIGGWRDAPATAGPLARAIALAAAQAHLASGNDVVIPQYLGRLPFLEQLDRLAAETGVDFYEIVLFDTEENALRRYINRSRVDTSDPAHVEKQEVLDRHGDTDELARMYDRLLNIIAVRPRVRVVETTDSEIAKAYRDFVARLSS